MGKNYYANGDYNVIDDRSGFKKKRSQCQKTWDNLIVDAEGFEERHPQDFVRSVVDQQMVPDSRPELSPDFIEPNDVQAGDL